MVDVSRIAKMPEPAIKSALEGHSRKLDDFNDDIDFIDLQLLKASQVGVDSGIYLNLKSQLQIAVVERKDIVRAKRLLESRLVDVVYATFDAGIAAAAGAAEDVQQADGFDGRACG